MAWTIAGTGGPIDFRGSRDEEGHREYEVDFILHTTSNQDGPKSAMNADVLPAVGSLYVFGSNNEETDLEAWCRPRRDVKPAPGYKQGDFPYYVIVTVYYSTKLRVGSQERPYDGSGGAPAGADVGDPLTEPVKVSGSFVNFTEMGLKDRFGNDIKTSSHEKILGPSNEWETGRDQVVMEQNVLFLNYQNIMRCRHRVNSTPIWGLPKRSVKLSNATWRKNWGKLNSVYYTRVFTFDINVRIDDVSRGFRGRVTTSSTTIALSGLSGVYGPEVVGRTIKGYGIPAGATIVSVNPTLSTLTISSAATKTGNVYGVIGGVPGTLDLVGNWDRNIQDEGTKALRGHWNTDGTIPRAWILDGTPNPDDPQDFVATQDTNGNFSTVLLNGAGVPYSPTRDENPGNIHVEYYGEADFLALLGLPASF